MPYWLLDKIKAIKKEILDKIQAMEKEIAKFKDDKGRILIVMEDNYGNFYGEVYESVSLYVRFHVSWRAIFFASENENNLATVCEYFGFKLSDEVPLHR